MLEGRKRKKEGETAIKAKNIGTRDLISDLLRSSYSYQAQISLSPYM
jgi:hypothetical protein